MQLTAIAVIVVALAALAVLLRAADTPTDPTAADDELKHARRRLADVIASLEEARHGTERRPVTRTDVRRAVECLAGCVDVVRRVVPESEAAATLAAVGKGAASLRSIVSTLEETGRVRRRVPRKGH